MKLKRHFKNNLQRLMGLGAPFCTFHLVSWLTKGALGTEEEPLACFSVSVMNSAHDHYAHGLSDGLKTTDWIIINLLGSVMNVQALTERTSHYTN